MPSAKTVTGQLAKLMQDVDYSRRFGGPGPDIMAVLESIFHTAQEKEQQAVSKHPKHRETDDPAYAALVGVLERAYEQSAGGKGKDRHVKSEGQRFERQPICELQRLYGSGYAFGQVGKKMEEAQRLPKEQAVAELLGGIVYLAAAVIVREEED